MTEFLKGKVSMETLEAFNKWKQIKESAKNKPPVVINTPFFIAPKRQVIESVVTINDK